MKLLKGLFTNWNSSRLLRLVLGIIFMIAYIVDGQGLFMLLSVFMLVQAVMNIGCGCVANNCDTTLKSPETSKYQFEELESDKKNDI